MAHTWVEQGSPIPVHWAGWESNTYQLGRCGWKVAHEVDHYRLKDRFMFHHPGYGVTALGEMREPMRSRHNQYKQNHDVSPISIVRMASKGDFHVRMEMRGFEAFHRIDTETSVIKSSIHELHALPMFASLFDPRPETQELIVEPQDVQQLLDQILKMQSPSMKDIRARDRKRDQPERKQFHAQIISLAA